MDPEVQAKIINEQAWKHIGYPGFCEFANIDDDFQVLRRFGALNIRVLLDLQFQITQLECELHSLDQACRQDLDLANAANRMDSLAWDTSDHNERRRRGELARELQPLLHVYSELDINTTRETSSDRQLRDAHLAAFLRVKQQKKASREQCQNVQNWFDDHQNAVCAEEQEYLHVCDDLITLSQKAKTPVQKFCERWPWMLKVFGQKRTKLPDWERGVHLISDEAILWFADSIIILLGLVMLFGPMWWLEWVSDDVDRLAIITCFIFVFAVGLRLVSRVKPFEVLAATAAYSAVLMVFLQKQAAHR